MPEELPKAYRAENYEDKIYQLWEKSGFFSPDNLKVKGEPFVIMMPPPNATGQLHIGHAMFLAIQDLMIRYQRMQGRKTLWLPGVDHAAIATQNKVEKLLAEAGKTKADLGREKFLKEVDEFVEKSRGVIKEQIRKMGASCDWSRERFTLDKGLTKAVQTVFVEMYKDGLIYQGERLVNWCPRCQSTLADDEVEHQEQSAKLYYIKYGPLIIATARPETKLGDTGVGVHPDDKRYKDFVGQELKIDLAGHQIKVKVFADEEVDPGFGSGAIGVTPAHSMIDEKWAKKHGLKSIQVIDEQGKMTKQAGKYQGLAVLQARKKLLKDLGELIVKVEDYLQAIPICYRCGTTIENLPSQQWFIAVDKKLRKLDNQSLKERAITVVKRGQIKIIPRRFEKIYFNWLENLHDWCISRQIWYGHRMPVWHRGKEIRVQIKKPGKDWQREEDTLDTWFSSGLWTFSTLGWPEETKDLKEFHPTSVMETGYDILFFWVARMILMSEYALQEVPFKTIYLHGLARTRKGEKMSKSKPETCIDPLTVIKDNGADALRLSLVIGSTPGNDIRLYPEKITGFKHFVNKLWNISRYTLGKLGDEEEDFKIETLAERWIVSRMNRLIQEVTDDLNKYCFSLAGEKIYEFLWHQFADWYLEINKKEPNAGVLRYCLENILKLLHPFTPFVTEVIWSALAKATADKQELGQGLLMVASWPKADEKLIDVKAEEEFAQYQRKVQEQRMKRIKTEQAIFSRQRSRKQKAKLVEYIKSLEKRLKNKNFIKNAPAEVVTAERKRLAEAQKEVMRLPDE